MNLRSSSRSGRHFTAQQFFQTLGFFKKNESQAAAPQQQLHASKTGPDLCDSSTTPTKLASTCPTKVLYASKIGAYLCDSSTTPTKRDSTLPSKVPVDYSDLDSDSESIKNPFTDSESSEWNPTDSDDDDDDSDNHSDSSQMENVKMFPANDDSEKDCSNSHPSEHMKRNSDNYTAADCFTDSKHTETVSDSESDNSVCSLEYPALSLDPNIPPQFTVSSKKWSKKHHCLFCEKFIIKIARHMEQKHKNETRVAQILTLPVKSRARRDAWSQLLKEGDYQHNYCTLKDGNGLIIPQYGKATSYTDQLIPCPNCKALYKKKYLSKHSANCTHVSKGSNKRGYVGKQGQLLLPVLEHTSKSFWQKVILSMNVDKISKICKNDRLILKYGERIFCKRDVEEHTPNNVSSRLRELGRLVEIVRVKSNRSINNLSDVLHVTKFDLLLSCVRELADYSDETHQLGKGSLALRLGYSLKKCASIKKMEAKKRQNEEEQKHAQDFFELIECDWSDFVSSTANQSLERKRFNRPLLLPSCNDVHKLYNYVKNHEASDYPTLVQATLCEISLFNRKRGGEVQRMTVDDYEKGLKSDDPNDDVMNCLDETEKHLVKQLSRVEIRGKFNRKVPIILTNSMSKKLTKIFELRNELNITSKYLFVRLNGEKPYRGSDIIRTMATADEVENESFFTWTCLRKHVATLCQAMEVSENDQDLLADFLGHDIRVHRQYYRLPNSIMERARVAKILMQVNSGSLSSTKDVDVTKDEEMPVEDIIENQADSDSDLDEPHALALPQSQSTHETNDHSATVVHQSPMNMMPFQKNKKGKKRVLKRTWNYDEEQAVMKHLGHCVLICKVPNKEEILKVLERESALQDRTWRNVKDYVYA